MRKKFDSRDAKRRRKQIINPKANIVLPQFPWAERGYRSRLGQLSGPYQVSTIKRVSSNMNGKKGPTSTRTEGPEKGTERLRGMSGSFVSQCWQRRILLRRGEKKNQGGRHKDGWRTGSLVSRNSREKKPFRKGKQYPRLGRNQKAKS